MAMPEHKLTVFFDGYNDHNAGITKANCTSTLIETSKMNIIVDTRTSWDGEAMISKLKEHTLTPDDIHMVICTHGHSDHVGCNYLFKKAKHFIGSTCISYEDTFSHDYINPYLVDRNLEIIATPGHSGEDVSVIVTIGDQVYAVVGDLFECEEDLKNPKLWKDSSSFPKIQQESREKVLEIADYIIPGHGPLFLNPNKLNCECCCVFFS